MSNGFDPRTHHLDGQNSSPRDDRHTADNAARGPKSALALGAFCAVGVCVGAFFALTGQPRDGATDTVEVAALPDDAPNPVTELLDLRQIETAVQVRRVSGELERRDTLTDLLSRLGVERADANAALYALYDNDLIDPRRVHPGLRVEAVFETAETGAERLLGLMVRADSDRGLTVSRELSGDFAARETFVALTPAYQRVSGEIETSLYQAALDDGAGDQQVVDFAQIFAYDVDFQREIRQGDTFEIVFETFVDERGRPVRTGSIVYAELNGRFTDRAFYRFTPSDDGIEDYYDAKGKSARKFLMKTPINGARLSSNFGMRRHPISGYSKMHKGTDFAAPTGTPVYAAGNGVVERASRYGGYGNYVRIQHPNGYETAYAHLSRYGPGIKSGTRVRQGQIIGYVGSTGASTGPHLHYEVLLNGKQVDAMSLKLPTGRVLEDEILNDFQLVRDEIDRLRNNLGAEVEFAELPDRAPMAANPR